jgi:protein-tyrosine phosphatase
MAEGVFRRLLRDRGLEERFEVDSAGTSSWHVGERPDPRTLEVLARHGVRLSSRARRIGIEDGDRFDWILTMDGKNLREVKRMLPAKTHPRVHPVMSVAGGGSVPDPYFGGDDGFEHVYEMLVPVLEAWLDRMG